MEVSRTDFLPYASSHNEHGANSALHCNKKNVEKMIDDIYNWNTHQIQPPTTPLELSPFQSPNFDEFFIFIEKATKKLEKIKNKISKNPEKEIEKGIDFSKVETFIEEAKIQLAKNAKATEQLEKRISAWKEQEGLSSPFESDEQTPLKESLDSLNLSKQRLDCIVVRDTNVLKSVEQQLDQTKECFQSLQPEIEKLKVQTKMENPISHP
ncbi:uncharacterized protein MONOS_17525 [Monocercomonoides exilis]|uniref:uncharacterized protein n=1 Tax=Monocercomonoides exilis TaxID=2049356 RepID=UPI00355A97E1|nr:hypothetical protein MONOS_17525 [Monocercomonoides exilis]